MTKRKPQTVEIEAGDLVEVLASDEKYAVGMVGIFDQEWRIDGAIKFVVLFDGDEFAYATEIKLYRKRA